MKGIDKTEQRGGQTKGELLRSRLPALVAASLLLIALVVAAVNLSGRLPDTVLQGKQAPHEEFPVMQLDEKAKQYTSAEAGGLTMSPGYTSVTIPAGASSVKMILLNPVSSAYNFSFEIILTDIGETIYTSGLVEPGMFIEDVTLTKGLAQGGYKATLQIRYYEPEGLTAVGGASIDFDLLVE